MTVKIDRNAGKAPRPVVEKFVAGQVYPFLAMLTHKNEQPLVIPSSGVNDPIAPGVETKVKVRNFDQAWMLVSDLAELAHRADNDTADFAVLTAPAVEATTQVQEVAPVDPVADQPAAEGVKPSKGKETK